MALRRERITPEASLFVDPASSAPRAVTLSFPHDTWKARQPEGPGQLPHPGTALKIAESWFEITTARPDSNRPGAYVYELSPWDDSFTIRATDAVTPEACRAAAGRYQEAQERRRKGAWLGFFPFLTGLLPAKDQEYLQRQYGVSAMRATFLSALPLLGGSTLALLIGIAAFFGHSFGDWNDVADRLLWPWGPPLLLLFVESIARVSIGLSATYPLGSFFVAIPVHVLHFLHATVASSPHPPPPQASTHAFSRVRDTVRPWPGPEADLEVLSRLPKQHWTANTTGILFGGKTYVLLDRQKLDQGEERYRFLLAVPKHEVLFTCVYEYQPEEVREIYREQRHLDSAAWVESLALVWGLLDHQRQERLAATYKYDPHRMTGMSILVSGALSALVGWQSLARLRAEGGVLDAVVFLFSGVVLWEAALRWSHWKAGRWRASLLSFLVVPWADRALRWQSPPSATPPPPRQAPQEPSDPVEDS